MLGGEVFPYEVHQRYFREQLQPRLNSPHQFLGKVSFARKRRLLASARCLLQPSLCPESSSLVAMEALACGTPVVAFPSGALPEIVEHGVTGYLVKDAKEMAEAIRAVGELDSHRCRERSRQRFSLDRMISEYMKLYTGVTAGQPPSLQPKTKAELSAGFQTASASFSGLNSSVEASFPLVLTGGDSATPEQDQSNSPSTAPLQVEILTRPEEMDGLAAEWRVLWEKDLRATPFQSPEWLIPCLERRT